MNRETRPTHLLLWLNNRCNARCPMCEIWREKERTFIPASEIESMAADWVDMGIREVELCGEPTLHPELAEICRILDRCRIRMRFLSNGLLLKKYAALVARYGTSLTISLDGPPAIHNTVRNVPSAYERLEAGIAELRRIVPDMPIHGRCVVHRLNYPLLRETVDTARRLALDDISFLGLDVGSPAFGRESAHALNPPAVGALVIPRDAVPALRQAVEQLIDSQAGELGQFVRETADVLRSVLVGHVEAYWEPRSQTARVVECDAPWTSAVIEPDGAVRPCWFLPAYGNLRDYDSLSALLESPEATRYRNGIDVSSNPMCRACVCPRMLET